MHEEKAETKTSSKKSKGRRKHITYVYKVSETPMSPEEWEQVQRLLAKIIAEAYLKDLRSQKGGEGSSATQAADGTGEPVPELAEKGLKGLGVPS